MPIPPRTLMQMIKRDITGTEGSQKIDILRNYMADLPGYYQGDFGKLRKWIKEEIERTKVQSSTKNSESFFIAKEGDKQIALLGMPNAGKSSLLKALTGRQIKIGNYPYTTTKPTESILKVNGALLQLVEVPGIFEGAADGFAGGTALLAAARAADLIVWVVNLGLGGVDAMVLAEESEKANLAKPKAIIGTHCEHEDANEARQQIAELDLGAPLVCCSNTSGENLDQVAQTLWEVSSLIRVYLKPPQESDPADEPMAMPANCTVEDLAYKIHKDILENFKSARVWGDSAKFEAQSVGLNHVLADKDIVEICTI